MCMRLWTTFLDPHVPKTMFSLWISTIFGPHVGHHQKLHRPPSKPKNQGPISSQHLRSASDFIKRLKNVKLSSKSGFSPQELPNLSQNTNMKWLKNVKLSSKSCFSFQELQNLSQDTFLASLCCFRMATLPYVI